MIKLNSSILKRYLFSLGLAILTYIFYILIINNDDKYFVVPLQVIYPPQYVAANKVDNTVAVTLRGSPASLTRVSLDDMQAVLDLSNVNVVEIKNFSVVLERSGVFEQIDNLEVIVNPSVIEVILEERVSKSVMINPSFINSLPKGYLFENYSVSPARVDISGPSSVISELEAINTESIDLALLTHSRNRITSLVLPDFIDFQSLSKNEVTVYVRILEAISVETFDNLFVSVNNLFSTFGYKFLSTPQISIVVQGPQLLVENLKPQVFIDVSSVRSSGTYEFDIQTNLPDGIEIVSFSPSVVPVSFYRITNAEDSKAEDSKNEIENIPQSIPEPDFLPNIQKDGTTRPDRLL